MMRKSELKYTWLTVRSSKYMVFDKKSMPIVAYKTIIALKHCYRNNTCLSSISQKNYESVWPHCVFNFIQRHFTQYFNLPCNFTNNIIMLRQVFIHAQ